MANRVKIKILKQGLKEVLNSSSVEAAVLNVAQDIQQDLGTDYEAEVYDYGAKPRNRKVAVVKDPREGAFYIEANKGYIAKAINKRKKG
jgi:hypothetical protein